MGIDPSPFSAGHSSSPFTGAPPRDPPHSDHRRTPFTCPRTRRIPARSAVARIRARRARRARPGARPTGPRGAYGAGDSASMARRGRAASVRADPAADGPGRTGEEPGGDARELSGGAATAAPKAPGRRRVRALVRVRVQAAGPCPGRAVAAVRDWGGRDPGGRAAARAHRARSAGAGRPAPDRSPLRCRARGRSSLATPFATLPRARPLQDRRIFVGRLVQHHRLSHQHVRPPLRCRGGCRCRHRFGRRSAMAAGAPFAAGYTCGELHRGCRYRSAAQPALPAAEKYAREAGSRRTTEIAAVKMSGA